MKSLFGIPRKQARVFLPPYEWYNQEIVQWTTSMGFTLINLSPGPGTARDYTSPQMGQRYTPSKTSISDLMNYESEHTLHGHILLIHLGTDPRRPDQLAAQLGEPLAVPAGRRSGLRSR